MSNYFVLKNIERRSRCHKLSAFTATACVNLSPVHGGESVCKV